MSLLPGPGDSDLVDTLLQMRAEAERARQRVAKDRRWKECQRSYRNRSYYAVPRPQWMAKYVAPKTWEGIERSVPVLTDSKPKLLVTPRGYEDHLAAEYLQKGLDVEMDRQAFMVLMPKLLRDAMIRGTSFMLTRVERVGSRNVLKTELLKSWNVYPDPQATTDDDLEWVWIRRPLSGARIAQLFPKQAKQIFAEYGTTEAGPRIVSYPDQRISPDPSFTEEDETVGEGEIEVMEVTRGSLSTRELERVYDVWEGYFVERNTVDVEIKLRDGSTARIPVGTTGQGRIVTMCANSLLEDRPNGFAHGMIPLSRLTCYDLPGEYFGQSYIEPLLDPHDAINDIENTMINWMKLASDPVLKGKESALESWDKSFNAPGARLPYQGDDGGPEWLLPPNMPSYIQYLHGSKNQDFNNAGGFNDISKGNIGGALGEDVSGRAIELLQEPTYTRLRLIQRNLEATISRWGKQTAANALQWWSIEDWLRVLPPEAAMMPLPWSEWNLDDLRDWPDVQMTVGSSLPANKNAKRNEIMMYYQAGLLGMPGDPETVKLVLDYVEFPDKEKALANVMRGWQQMQMMQMMGGGVSQNGNPPSPPGTPASPPDQFGRGPNPALNRAAGGEPVFEEVNIQ